MNNEINYPVRYTYIPVYGKCDWKITSDPDDLYNSISIRGYIVSRCYLVSEYKKYNSDGEVKSSYEILFPNDNKNNLLYRDVIFNSLEEARNYTDMLNRQLFLDYIINLKNIGCKDVIGIINEVLANFKITLQELYLKELELEQSIIEGIDRK